jgi:hypothetical protein
MWFEIFMGKDAINYGDWPFGLEDLELIGDHKFVVGIPYDSPPQFRRLVFAAAKTYYLRKRLKLYGSSWKGLDIKAERETALIHQVTASIKTVTRRALKSVFQVQNKPDHLGLFVSEAALLCLQNTFRAGIFAIHNGFHFEASSLSRMILEQLAWIYVVHKLNDGELFKVKPTHCITNLKQVFPDAGRLYSELSNVAHISPKTIIRYIEEGEGDIGIRPASTEHAASDVFIMLWLADVYAILTEIVYEKLLTSFVYTKLAKNAGRLPKKSRPTQKLLTKFKKPLASLASHGKKKNQDRA